MRHPIVYPGMAMDMEEGWYGAKMTGSSVKVAFPGPRKTTQNYRYIGTGTSLLVFLVSFLFLNI
jgi:hypothetical protein